MTTPAQGNFSESAGKQPEGGFEASGLSADEAERLAASFKPSWEFDEAPFAQGNGGLDAAQIEAFSAGGVSDEIAGPPDSRTVPPHAPPQRMETHEPEVSVIIDRSITSAEMEAQRSPPPPHAVRPVPVESPFAAPAFAPVPQAAPQRIAPVMRAARSADESLELPASLKKSNKGLFIGLGVAVAAAGLVFVVHGAMSSSDATPPATTTDVASATPPTAETPRANAPTIPPVPAAPPPAAPVPPAPQAAATPAAAPPAPAPQRYTPPPPSPRPQPRAAAPAVHHPAAPKNPPKATGGGIVRDVPF